MKALQTLFLAELADRYESEIRQVREMRKMIDAATSVPFQILARAHLITTTAQVEKLILVFHAFDMAAQERNCLVTIGILQETDRMTEDFVGSPAINAGLISMARKMRRYEIVSYTILHEWAVLLGNHDAAGLLEQILDEEKSVDQSLIELAHLHCNRDALEDHEHIVSYCDRYGHKIS